MCKEVGVTCLKVVSVICLEGMKKTMKTLGQPVKMKVECCEVMQNYFNISTGLLMLLKFDVTGGNLT